MGFFFSPLHHSEECTAQASTKLTPLSWRWLFHCSERLDFARFFATQGVFFSLFLLFFPSYFICTLKICSMNAFPRKTAIKSFFSLRQSLAVAWTRTCQLGSRGFRLATWEKTIKSHFEAGEGFEISPSLQLQPAATLAPALSWEKPKQIPTQRSFSHLRSQLNQHQIIDGKRPTLYVLRHRLMASFQLPVPFFVNSQLFALHLFESIFTEMWVCISATSKKVFSIIQSSFNFFLLKS